MFRRVKSLCLVYRAFTNWLEVAMNLLFRQLPGFPTAEFTAISRSGTAIVIPAHDESAWAAFEVFAQDVYDVQNWVPSHGSPVILDVGANIGTFSLAAVAVNPNARVCAFEPGTLAYARLLRNVDINGYTPQIVCTNAAVIGRQGIDEIPFFESTNASIVSTTIRGGTDGAGSWKNVPALSLSDALSKHEHVDLFKIDIEGGEYDVFFNTPREALAVVDRIVLEYHPAPGASWSMLRDYIIQAGFRLVKEQGSSALGMAWFCRR